MKELRFAALTIREKLKALKREVQLDNKQLLENLNLNYNQYKWHYEGLEKFQGDVEIWKTNKDYTEIYNKLCEFYKEDFIMHKDKYLDEDEIERSPLAIKIIRQRKKLNDNQKALADVIQVDEISIISWESGERIPNERCLKKLTEYLELN